MFGHHHAQQNVASGAAAFVHGVPVPIWVAAIGVLAAIGTPVVQNLIERARAGSLAAADGRRRAEEHAQTVARVRADLLFRQRAHVVFLGSFAHAGGVDVDRWHQAFERFAARTRDADVIETLGDAYHAFVLPVHAERVAIEVERSALVGARPPGVASERIAAVAAAYDASLAMLG
jgi:hypothetical protein